MFLRDLLLVEVELHSMIWLEKHRHVGTPSATGALDRMCVDLRGHAGHRRQSIFEFMCARRTPASATGALGQVRATTTREKQDANVEQPKLSAVREPDIDQAPIGQLEPSTKNMSSLLSSRTPRRTLSLLRHNLPFPHARAEL